MYKLYYIIALCALLGAIYLFFIERELTYGAASILISAVFTILFATSSSSNQIERTRE